MGTPTIGIKIADRTYYPILDKGSPSRKRLVLTTVKDQQESVQIDLYENEGDAMESAEYVGSLLIENIAPAIAGEADIELLIGIDEQTTLLASARESSSGEHQSLSVSLESLAEDGVYDIPEFELDDDLDTWPDESDDELTQAEEASEEDANGEHEGYGPVGIEEQEAIVERKRPVLLGLFIALGLVGLVLIAILLFKLLDNPKALPLEARSAGDTTPTVEAGREATNGGAALPAGGGPAETTVVAASGSGGAVSYGQSVSDDSLGGAWYWIRWGDTLWELSSSFYRNPWLYRVIAEQNNIADPDLIFAGSRIYIPSR